MNFRHKNNGNALFFILIAVALFAALTYAITQSERGSGSVTREKVSLALAEMNSFASEIQNTMTRLELASGCTVRNTTGNTMNFGPTTIWPGQAGGAYNNTYSPVDGSCDVFQPNGEVAMRQLPAAAQQTGKSANYGITRHFTVNGVGTNGTGYTDPEGKDLTLVAAVNEDLCNLINKYADVSVDPLPNLGGMGSSTPAPSATAFRGDYLTSSARIGFEAANSELIGKETGCIYSASGSDYTYYHVLIAR